MTKRFSCSLLVAILSIVGCNDAKTPTSGARDPSEKEPVVSKDPPVYQMDLEGVGIPDIPLVGQVNGKKVILGAVGVTRTPDGTDAATGLNFSVNGKSLTVSLPSNSVVHTDKKWAILKPSNKMEDYGHLMVGITGKAHYYHSFVIRLELGKPVDGKLPGRIYLCLPDEEKSFIAGKFEANMPTK